MLAQNIKSAFHPKCNIKKSVILIKNGDIE